MTARRLHYRLSEVPMLAPVVTENKGDKEAGKQDKRHLKNQ